MYVLKYKFWVILAATLVAVLVPTTSSSAISKDNGRPKLIIDHDGGADDAMAIFMALLSEKYLNGPTVIALTTTHGNVDEDQAFLNTQRFLDVAGRRDIPIYRGSNDSIVTSVPSDGYFGADGIGDNDNDPIETIEAQDKNAALAIIELAKKYPGEITLVAIGAQTNVALALLLDPELHRRLSHLYVGAGNVYSETETAAEFNAEQDAEAYRVVIKNASPEKVTIVPFSQVRTRNVTKQWREDVLGAIPTKIMKAQNSFERISLSGTSNTWSLLDPVVLGVVLSDTIVGDVKYSQNDIIFCGEQRGINTNNFTTIEEANVRVINQILQDEYKNLLYSIFSAELEK